MSSYFGNLIQQVEAFNIAGIMCRFLVVIALGFVIYLSYYLFHVRTVYSHQFNVCLAVLPLLTTQVMIAIGNNVALALGMVGALSIVHFRTAMTEFRDAIYIFWAMLVGLACGVGDYSIAGAGSAIFFLILLILGFIKNENRVLLIICGANSTEARIMSVVRKYFKLNAEPRVKNIKEDTIELFYEIPRKIYDKASEGAESIEDQLYEIENIQYVNIQYVNNMS